MNDQLVNDHARKWEKLQVMLFDDLTHLTQKVQQKFIGRKNTSAVLEEIKEFVRQEWDQFLKGPYGRDVLRHMQNQHYVDVKPGVFPDQLLLDLCFPEFEHDCCGCVFLGSFDGHDLYCCIEGYAHPMVMARFGNESRDYKSGIWCQVVDPILMEASKRARIDLRTKEFLR